jgi:ribosomal protein RSM22 (predicted rRNA methylase)
VPGLSVQSLLDIGAGPGTTMWSAVELFPFLSSITLLEQDPRWITLGKHLASEAEHPAIKEAHWRQEKVTKDSHFEPHDLIVLSYMIGELLENEIRDVVSNAWQAASHVAAFIEPGTPNGFKNILIARDTLIALGAHLVAPCPHSLECPMAKKGDWCHFSERLERSELHREIKDVSLGYEDEKYSYVVGSKQAIDHPTGRILRHPQKRAGHLSFILCTAEGLKQRVISRREGEVYKQARKLSWGDCLDPN